ncbi:unnamed protein product [Sphagnum troendelagicum]
MQSPKGSKKDLRLPQDAQDGNQRTFRPKKSTPSRSKIFSIVHYPPSSPHVCICPVVVGITFEFTPGGFRTAGDQKQLHWLTEKLLSCWNFDYVLDPPWERWLCGKHFISKPMPLFWTDF